MKAEISRRQVLALGACMPMLANSAAASSNVDRLMVQGHLSDSGSVYKVKNIMPALDALGGIRKMRCRIPYEKTAGWYTYSGLAREGIKFCLTLPHRPPAYIISNLLAFETQFPGSIWAIEFPNEPDLNPMFYNGIKDARLGARTGNAPALMAFCRDITRSLEEVSSLRSIPRIAFNDWMQREQKEMTHFANSHIYPKPTTPSGKWHTDWVRLLKDSGHSRGVITEWGRTTGGDFSNVVARPVTLEQQANLIGSDLTSVLSESTVEAISLYELFSWPGTGEQNNFGLFNSDLTPRPVVSVIRSIAGK